MTLKDFASIALMIIQIITCAVLLIKPLREWVMGVADVREGVKSGTPTAMEVTECLKK